MTRTLFSPDDGAPLKNETHTLFFSHASAPLEKDRKAYPPAPTIDTLDTDCVVELPKAPDRGCWHLTCRNCSAWAVVAVQNSVDDPKSFMMECGRRKIREEL
jgi:hypothetical protein